MMNGDWALGLMNGMLWQSMLVASPVMLAALLVGVIISILQVATQLQEMTLSYIPKLVVSALVLVALGPWMIGQVTEFATAMIATIPRLG